MDQWSLIIKTLSVSLTEEKACRGKQDTLSETHEPLQQQVFDSQGVAGFGLIKFPRSLTSKKTD